MTKPISSFSELRLLESYGAMRVSLEFSHKLLQSLSPQVFNDLEVILIESSFGEYRLLNGKSLDLKSFTKYQGKYMKS